MTFWRIPPDGTGTTIPDMRIRLTELAEWEDANGHPTTATELRQIVEMLKRRKPVRHAAPRQGPMNRGIAKEIREYNRSHPEATEFEIGHHFNVNQGRVSEALHGKRR